MAQWLPYQKGVETYDKTIASQNGYFRHVSERLKNVLQSLLLDSLGQVPHIKLSTCSHLSGVVRFSIFHENIDRKAGWAHVAA